MWAVIFLLVGLAFVYGQECLPCDTGCGDWSCITNCSQENPPTDLTFDRPRCAVDINGNGQIDSCSELLACQVAGGRYVCPRDMGDQLCTSGEWNEVEPFDTNPQDFDASIVGVYLSAVPWTYIQYQQKLSQYSLVCPQAPQSTADRVYQYALQRGWLSPAIWVCGGAMYADVWFSYYSCSYISYDGSVWRVRNNACSDPNKVWIKLGQKCYATSWSHSIYVNAVGQYYYLTWNVPVPQGNFNQTQTVNVNGQSYSVNMRCVSSTTVMDEATGQQIQLCTQFVQTVSGPGVSYTLYWFPDTSWSCPVYGGSQSSSYTYETMSPLATSNFSGVLEERQNNVVLRGVGVDMEGSRCRVCATSLRGLSKGVEKILELAENQMPDFDRIAECVNPRFFSGQVRTCRPGGITALGASCCGLSGWTKGMCSRGERELKKRREAGTCTEVGTYCAKRILGVCLEWKRSFCCFNSKLARIFQECGRPQIGKGWGTGRRPDCSGYTIEEFSRVDFSDDRCIQMIEEWATEMANRLGDRVADQIAGKAVDRIQNWLGSVKNQKDYGGEK